MASIICFIQREPKVLKEIPQQKRDSNKENAQPVVDNLPILKCETFKQVEDKENTEFIIQDISQQYYFSIDNLFLTSIEYHDVSLLPELGYRLKLIKIFNRLIICVFFFLIHLLTNLTKLHSLFCFILYYYY